MEGGAKGQVGGMEMGEEERKRLAAESRSWRCQGCGGSTNEEILQEEEKRVHESEGSNGSAKQAAKEQVPDELRFGFRDEMEKELSQDKGKGKERINGDTGDDKTESAIDQRRESPHFAGPEDLKSLPSPVPLSPPPAPMISPAQPLRQPIPTRTTPVPQISTESGVPGWVDKAIIGVIAGLVVMVVKKIAI